MKSFVVLHEKEVHIAIQDRAQFFRAQRRDSSVIKRLKGRWWYPKQDLKSRAQTHFLAVPDFQQERFKDTQRKVILPQTEQPEKKARNSQHAIVTTIHDVY